MFTGNSTYFEKYISAMDNESESRVKIAYMLESLHLGTYELVGGQLPQLFIRINDPYKVKQLADSKKYINEVLEDIDDRRKESVATMERFFKAKLNNKERWDFIENYFLGKM